MKIKKKQNELVVEGDLTSVSMTVGGAMNKYNMFAAFHNNHIITFIMKP